MVEQFAAGDYDVIVVGAGHAGCEAALATSRMGQKTLLITISIDMVAFMPCNPSIGGPAKGVVVREIDALGGEMGVNIDKTYIQMRMLNVGKGPAVRALRAQADKEAYARTMRQTVEAQENLDLRQGIVSDLVVEEGQCRGVITETGAVFRSQAVILTVGTAARGEIIIGDLKYSSGPNNSQAATELTKNLAEKYGFDIVRFKTGTPPRVAKDSVDYDQTSIQPGDETPHHFSFLSDDEDYLPADEQIPCWLTYTNEGTHEIIRENLDRAPMFTGIVDGVGARYCPSIEDKIVRFADKDKHQLFLEPEGRYTNEIYVQGLSTSMPEEVQEAMIHSIKGLEKARIMRDGYAIEYDVVRPNQLKMTFETKHIDNLYTAGQTNGTSGYEEAAGQGLYAGINAALKIQGKDPFIIGRDEAYIGVMVDDLVTKGTTEPYRLLTSRAEYRLLLRHDNADLRLTEYGRQLGLVTDERYQRYLFEQNAVMSELNRLQTTRLKPTAELQAYLEDKGSSRLKDGILAADLLKRPELKITDILKFAPSDTDYPHEVWDQVEIQVKYAGYIEKAQRNVDKLHRMESKVIPEDIDWDAIEGIATEARQRLAEIGPRTLAQASRVSGVNPADISILAVYLQSGKVKRRV
ncbi:tRNA uridine-5-carboxymethylaminomethyl(34) synthesis enzyme MnmG [Aerococcus sanguinicola]|uniref:tRNA uridine 5-carboxymethylaminomethyl modification enzyme MnmG n=1 Tax=Aerococcus sanguinicola TaxID=119206 RepID=A0A0X8FB81_9LACT|nr:MULTISPECIES: tRNA uridine-5-carboxymethylaminomethyl(34) synthesis enzyme MnmG [Aerococcus]AMB94018.1 tRNA uridine 5-carboxymethylaminomethyl modification protein [Aerococcus sanguinicola]MDK7050662.1 tRNA uridine-5-carboxymethylaminomethyl(34) synthesis enzyme MnmG [Aerococcus sanguinicola]OFT93599.1 tRNA uridine(34) 5-carboxymethylaminomethyl synthesis enzyme MnmG [Aerococcus sp. HMSC23C02]PKZ20787.1 tRNA uridine-5-carboxymethylaminomethyl(34) synthesis enzyme MnmG [Aerococcus sanguinicol